MNIKEKLNRSKNRDKIDFDKIGCDESTEPLVAVMSGDNLLVEPIWENPIDDLEGPLYQEYISENPNYKDIYLRQNVARRLQQVADCLSPDYKLVIRAGHRPVGVQLKLLNTLVGEYIVQGQSPEKALETARMYVSDPAVKLPPHCCGAAVDVDIMYRDSGELVDFGCPVNTDAEISFLHSNEITEKQRKNRTILLTAMLDAGFASYYAEWWHYSYGDQVWAHFYNNKSALYGIIEPNFDKGV